MKTLPRFLRREFLKSSTVAALVVATRGFAASKDERVFIASGSPNGILAYDWNSVLGVLIPVGVAAQLANVAWMTLSAEHDFLYAASEVDSFNGKQTGAVASFSVLNGRLQPRSAQNSAGPGTCHVALDLTGRVLVSTDYSGASAASFVVDDGRLKPAEWSDYYTGHGPEPFRQHGPHPHFANFSPDNRFVYINDLGCDVIHIYNFHRSSGDLNPIGSYRTRSGSGPRTLRFHPNGHTAYLVNELDSTVEVLEWNRADGALKLIDRIDLLPASYHGPTRACDTVISRDGKFVYFANRDNDFLYSFRANFDTGKLIPIGRSSCGGKSPRFFTLDPTERWMLVANQDSNQISVFKRNPTSGELADTGASFDAPTPMCIVFA
jgi:6-phosphogluconolactonase